MNKNEVMLSMNKDDAMMLFNEWIDADVKECGRKSYG